MENPEEILHSLEEFSKLKPKDIPRELEEYLCFVAKTGDPVYQWGTIKSLFREKLINVITDFYESCPSVDIPPCPNVEVFNYESMKTFILEKLDTFAAAPFTVQRICELLTTPRKEYNRIDKYMRALEKNILVVSTTEPGNRRTTENGEGIVNGLESEHLLEPSNTNNDINVEEMDDTPVWSRIAPETVSYQNNESNVNVEAVQAGQASGDPPHSVFSGDSRTTEGSCSSTPSMDSVITCRPSEEQPYVSIEPVASDSCLREDNAPDSDVTVTITAIPAAVQKRRDSIEPVVSSGEENTEQSAAESSTSNNEVVKEDAETSTTSPSSSSSSSSSPSSIIVEIPTSQETVPVESEAVNADISTSSTSATSDTKPIESDDSAEAANNDDSPLSNNVQMPCAMPESNEKELQTVKEDIIKSNLQSSPTTNSCDDDDTEREAETPVTSTNEIIQTPQIITDEILANDDKEESVSSTDDFTKESETATKEEEIDQTKDDANVSGNEDDEEEVSANCDLSADCSSNISADEDSIQGDSSQDDSNDKDKADEGFVSRSTRPEPMDIDISEDSCQEAPTSQS